MRLFSSCLTSHPLTYRSYLFYLSVGHSFVGTLWFAIFLQLFLILGVLYTLATDSISMHRFQISVFGAVAIVFAVDGVNQGIFSDRSSLEAMSAGWLILAIVNILWTLYFTSEEDSLMLHVFNSLGTGGLTPPSRRRRTRPMSVHNTGNGYTAYSATPGGMTSMGPGGYDAKMNNFGGGPIGSANSFKATSIEARSLGGAGSINNLPTAGSAVGAESAGLASPLMGSGAAGVGAGGGPGQNSFSTQAADTSAVSGAGMGSAVGAASGVGSASGDGFLYKAKALYTCMLISLSTLFHDISLNTSSDSASQDDPNEISFDKGDILEIIDKQGKWWQAKKSNGAVGSTYPSLSSYTSPLTPVYRAPQLRHRTTYKLSDGRGFYLLYSPFQYLRTLLTNQSRILSITFE